MELAKPPLPADVKRIVLLWIGRLGDFIVTTPVIHSIRTRFPNAHIVLVAGQGAYDAALLCPDLDEVRVLKRFTSPLANLNLASSLMTERADLLIDLNTSFSRASAALAGTARARLKIAFVKKSLNQAYSFHLAMPKETESMRDRYRRLAEVLGAKYDPQPKLPVPPKERQQAREILESFGVLPSDRRLVAVHPGNFKKFDNRWPEEKFVELTNRLLDRKDLQVVYMVGPGEETKAAAIIAKLKHSVPLIPATPLGVTAGLLSFFDLFIVNVTGTTHLAVATGTPTFSFRSRYTDTVWMPHASPHYGIVSDSWTSCRDISVDAAWKALSDVLKNLPRRGNHAG